MGQWPNTFVTSSASPVQGCKGSVANPPMTINKGIDMTASINPTNAGSAGTFDYYLIYKKISF